jgi:hypothetical protein
MGRALVVVAVACLLGVVLVRWGAASGPARSAAIPAADATPTEYEYCFAEWPSGSASPEVANNGAYRDVVANMNLDAATPWVVHLNRIHFHIGGSSPVLCYPPVVLYVESGTLTIELYVGEALFLGDAVLGPATPATPANYVATPGIATTITLEPGDAITLQNAIYSVHNNGWEDVVFVTAALMPGDLPCPPCTSIP